MMSLPADIVLSSYASKLTDEAKSRYLVKIQLIGGVDPFCSSTLGYLEQTDDCPPVDACDLLSYLVLRTSFIYNNRTVRSKKRVRSIQSVCVWLGKRSYHVESCWKICYNWKGK